MFFFFFFGGGGGKASQSFKKMAIGTCNQQVTKLVLFCICHSEDGITEELIEQSNRRVLLANLV